MAKKRKKPGLGSDSIDPEVKRLIHSMGGKKSKRGKAKKAKFNPN